MQRGCGRKLQVWVRNKPYLGILERKPAIARAWRARNIECMTVSEKQPPLAREPLQTAKYEALQAKHPPTCDVKRSLLHASNIIMNTYGGHSKCNNNLITGWRYVKLEEACCPGCAAFAQLHAPLAARAIDGLPSCRRDEDSPSEQWTSARTSSSCIGNTFALFGSNGSSEFRVLQSCLTSVAPGNIAW